MTLEMAKDVAHRMYNFITTCKYNIMVHPEFGWNTKIKGVYADISNEFDSCDNVGLMGGNSSSISDGYTRHKFKGLAWTEEELVEKLLMLEKQEFIKRRKKILKQDFV